MRFPGKSSPAATASAGSSKHENGSKFSFGVLAAMLACAAAFLGIGAPAAGAAPEAKPSFGFLTSFGSLNYATSGANSIAVDGQGNILAGQNNLEVLPVFAPDPTEGGTLLTEVVTSPASPSEIAVDPSDDTVYVRDGGYFTPAAILRFESDGNSPPTYTRDPSFEIFPPSAFAPAGLAVDPTTHDLLAADPASEAIQRYDTSGALVGTIATPSVGPESIAVLADGSIYVTQASSSVITHLSGAGTVLGEIAAGEGVDGLAINEADGILVAAVGASLKSFSLTSGDLLSTATAGNGEDASVKGIAIDEATGRLYSHMNSFIDVYGPAVEPGLEAPSVSAVTPDSAHLSAEVDPGDGPPTGSEAFFEYRLGTGDWQSTPAQELTVGDPTLVEADLTDLRPNSEYQVRTVAKNQLITRTSDPVSFSTPAIAPEVETGPAVVGGTSAILSGTVNAVGLQTTYYFEYGPDSGYGSRVPVAVDGLAGNAFTARSVTKTVDHLQAGTTYHYRLVATNSVGTTEGADRTFATAAAGDIFQRAYEQVTPVDKEGAQVNSDFHIQSAADGSAIAVSTSSATLDGTTSKLRQNYLSVRGESDWLDWQQIDAPQNVLHSLTEGSTIRVSSDFDHALVVSNRALAPGGIPGGGNLYIKDLTSGEYTFVGGAPGEEAMTELAGGQISETVYVAGAADFSWIMVYSAPPLLPGAPRAQIYRWDAADGLIVASLVEGNPVPNGVRTRQGDALYNYASEDGEVLYFGESEGAIYRREDGQTTVVSHADGSVIPSNFALPAQLDQVTPDGRYAVFHTLNAIPLTSDPVNPNGGAVYRYDSATDQITYIADIGGIGSTQAIISRDGQTVFVDRGQVPDLLGPTVVWHEGATHTLDAAGGQEMTLSPNGRYFSWLSRTDGMLRFYDVVTEDVVCVSCTADGSPSNARSRNDARSISIPRVVNDRGMMFFDSTAKLTSTDHNGYRDVYMYWKGSLTLISPGNADFAAQFVDASVDGSDVFFQTDQGLVGQDIDGETDVYDARVGGGFPGQSPPTFPAPCVRAECGSAGTSPADPVIGSMAGDSDSDAAKPKISGVKALSASDRAKLAKGKKVMLGLKVSQPGTVTLRGARVVSASVKAKKAGGISLPIRLSKSALSQLRGEGSLKVRFTIGLGGKPLETVSFTLRAANAKKGGRS